MSEVRFNLLTEPLLGIEGAPDGVAAVTLPGALARLGRGELIEFTALQSHQMHAWHAFVVQLAAIAAHNTGGSPALDVDEAKWCTRLRTLTEERDAPWCLFAADAAQPAFLQPPIPEGTVRSFDRVFETPDRLDVLVASKNHDLKLSRIGRSRAEHWVYALVVLQTTEGFLGRGNYGVSRMNGGFASRPSVGAAPGLPLGRRFSRDVRASLEARRRIVEAFGYADDGGIALVWTRSWGGDDGLSVAELDPFFIEVCRRVRLTLVSDALVGRGTGSAVARVDGKAMHGATGDVWTPVKRGDEGEALTVSGQGFTYSLMQDVLFETSFAPGAALAIRADDGEQPVVIARVLARGQGETNGLHERVVPVPPRARRLMAQAEGRGRIGQVAKRRVDLAATVRTKVLRPALCALLQAGAEKLDFQDKRPEAWTSELDARIDGVFFERLWDDVELDDTTSDRQWLEFVIAAARGVLSEASHVVPLPSMRRFRAVAAAESLFEGAARKHCPMAFGIETTSIQQGESTP